jgi:hypothetical protein
LREANPLSIEVQVGIMSLEKHLSYGEDVIGQSGHFYATSSRIIHYEQKGDVEEIHSLPYSSLETVKLETRPRYPFMILGTAIAILAAPLFFYLVLSAVFLLLGGIALAAYGVFGHEAYYRFYARNMTAEEMKLWRIPREGSGQMVATVRRIIGDTLEL